MLTASKNKQYKKPSKLAYLVLPDYFAVSLLLENAMT